MLADCPICGKKNCLLITSKTDKIPYFGEVMETTLLCQECGYKHSDSICLEVKEPIRFSLPLTHDNLNVRIVKSQSSTVTIPELGLKVEPGPKSQGYVSNIEGVLERFENAVKRAMVMAEEEKYKENAISILDNIEKIKQGTLEVTLVLEDPFGHGAILDEKADYRKLTENEIKNLKTGFTTLEK
jgi:zinc finger protein